MLDLVRQIIGFMGSEIVPVVLSTAQAEIAHLRLDTDKARRVLSWAPALDFVAGLQRTIHWYQDNQALLG